MCLWLFDPANYKCTFLQWRYPSCNIFGLVCTKEAHQGKLKDPSLKSFCMPRCQVIGYSHTITRQMLLKNFLGCLFAAKILFFRDIRRQGKSLINERNCWDFLLDFVSLSELVDIGQRLKLLHFSLRLKVALKDKVAPKIVFCDPLSNDQKLINMPKG